MGTCRAAGQGDVPVPIPRRKQRDPGTPYLPPWTLQECGTKVAGRASWSSLKVTWSPKKSGSEKSRIWGGGAEGLGEGGKASPPPCKGPCPPGGHIPLPIPLP